MRSIVYYQSRNGESPFREWLQRLDKTAQFKIDAYIKRTAMGAAKKNIRSLGDGVFEIKIDHGPGYRVYFGEVGGSIVLLLLGGDKSSQFTDIRKAKDFWRNYVSQ